MAAAAGAVMVAAFFVYDWWAASPMRFGLRRDFILNRHWIPRGAALLWVLWVFEGLTLLTHIAALGFISVQIANPNDPDLIAEFGGVTLTVDRMSAPYIQGATIDFVDTIEKQGFTIDNPNAGGSCACGDSFH